MIVRCMIRNADFMIREDSVLNIDSNISIKSGYPWEKCLCPLNEPIELGRVALPPIFNIYTHTTVEAMNQLKRIVSSLTDMQQTRQ